MACTCPTVNSASGIRPRYGVRYTRTCERYPRRVDARWLTRVASQYSSHPDTVTTRPATAALSGTRSRPSASVAARRDV